MACFHGAQSRRRSMKRAAPGAMPMKVLRDRLHFEPGAEVPEWARFLPQQLRPASLAPYVAPAKAPAPVAPVGGGRSSVEAKSGNGRRGGDADDCSTSTPEASAAAPLDLDSAPVVGRVWSLSQEARGCRMVQSALDSASSDAEREALTGELRGHIVEAARCPHANYVLQKVVILLRPRSLQFMIDELMQASISQIARHKYGCRIIQRLLEYCHVEQMSKVVDDVLTEVTPLSKHPYGTYVIQMVLQHGSEDQRRKVAACLIRDLRTLGAEPSGCASLGAALLHAEDDDRLRLARALLKEPGLLLFMASVRHGGSAVLRTLEVLRGSEREEAIARLGAEAESLKASRYGREVAEYLEISAAFIAEAAAHAGA